MSELKITNYRQAWDRILPGVIESLKYQNEGLRPEDIYYDLKSGNCALLTSDDTFLVVREIRTDTGDKDLLVVLSFSTSKEPAIPKYTQAMKDIARQVNCAGIRFVSTRRGYERALSDEWEMLHTTWRMKL